MIRVQGLRKSFGSHEVLRGISLHVPRDGAFGLLGPNGAGKTTLLSCIFGLLEPDAGEIRLGAARDGRGGGPVMSLVPQTLAFYPTLTVKENLDLFFHLNAARKRSAYQRAVEATGLSGRMGQRAGQLSGGLKRRLNLAIGLLNDPDMLCLDEPTVGIDPQSRRLILDVLAQLVRDGLSLVYTSHYMEEVQYLCDHVAIMDQGELLVTGTMSDLLGEGGRPLSLQVDGLPDDFVLPEGVHAQPVDGKTRLLADDVDTATVAKLMLKLAEAGLEADRVSFGERDLEEVFLRLTGRRLRDEVLA